MATSIHHRNKMGDHSCGKGEIGGLRDNGYNCCRVNWEKVNCKACLKIHAKNLARYGVYFEGQEFIKGVWKSVGKSQEKTYISPIISKGIKSY